MTAKSCAWDECIRLLKESQDYCTMGEDLNGIAHDAAVETEKKIKTLEAQHRELVSALVDNRPV